MARSVKYFLLGLMVVTFSSCHKTKELYSVAGEPWPESFGNHRAVLEVEKDADAVRLDLPWRRHDRDPQKRRLLLISANTGDTIPNIHRIRIDAEKCELLAGPVKAGSYHFYYLPFEVQEGYGFYNKGYLGIEDPADNSWLEAIKQEAGRCL